MSVVSLPPELKTQKVTSLDKDLRKVAEELIAKKFDIKEEVVEQQQAPDPFRSSQKLCGYCGRTFPQGVRCGCPQSEPTYSGGPGYGQNDPYGSRSGIPGQVFVQRVYDISFDGIIRGLRDMDRMNVPREGRTIHVGRYEFDRLRSDPRIGQHLQMHVDRKVATFMGCEIQMDHYISGIEIQSAPRWY